MSEKCTRCGHDKDKHRYRDLNCPIYKNKKFKGWSFNNFSTAQPEPEPLYTLADLGQAKSDERARCIVEIRDWCESEDDGDTSFNAGMGEAIRVIAALGPIGETRGETRPYPTEKARELAEKICRAYAKNQYGDALKGPTAIIQSALTQAREEATREAADRFCKRCHGRDEVNSVLVCEEYWDGELCEKRAAILGKEGKL